MVGMIAQGNLTSGLPDAGAAEVFQALLEQGGVTFERIVSFGQATPEGSWYDQEQNEWVLLIAGEAALQIDGEAEPRSLAPGDWIFLPAHCRHRVVWTMQESETVWLAVHWNGK